MELRPKVMSALISVSTLAAPLGFIAAGQLLGSWEATRVFAATAIGMTATALVFAAVAVRRGGEQPPEAEPLPA